MALSITIYDYYPLYRCKAFNRNGQLIDIEFQKKLEVTQNPPNVSTLKLLDFRCSYFNGNEEKFDPVIISQKAVIKVRAEYGSSSTINAEMFFANAYDEWKIVAKCDNVTVFVGFITMENEPYIMKEKPYDIVVTATDGLGLLKNIELTDTYGDVFTGRNTLLSYLQGALAKTNLKLDIAVYCNIYHASHKTRYDTGSPDMMTQTKLHHRTFLKDAVTYVDCYEAIEKILKNWCVIYQYKGAWLINNVMEMQANFGPQRYYSYYSYNGSTTNSVLETDNTCTIGKTKKIQPINLDQYVSYQYPVKSVKTSYKYEIPENLVNNQKLQYLGSWISPIAGSEYNLITGEYIGSYTAYEKVGWSNYTYPYVNVYPYTGAKRSYIKVVKDSFNTELDRYYVIEFDGSVNSGQGFSIVNDNTDFFMDEGDIVTISFQFRYNIAFSGPLTGFGGINVLRTGQSGASTSHWYSANPDGRWTNSYSGFAFRVDLSSGDEREWQSISVTTRPVPVNGSLFISIGPGPNFTNGTELHVKDINIEYEPRVRGSVLTAKGEYWKTEQTTNIKDIIEDEISVSDSPKRIIKGALWDTAGDALLTPEWYRLNESETKHFKELVNYGRYRHQYRRQKRVNGTFKGVMWSPDGGSATQYPLTFHRQFSIENDDRMYMLSAPLEIDYLSAQWKGTLIECGVGNTDYNNNGNTHTFNYLF